MKKNAKMQDICSKETKTTAASLIYPYTLKIQCLPDANADRFSLNESVSFPGAR